jgi:hypothetical protein
MLLLKSELESGDFVSVILKICEDTLDSPIETKPINLQASHNDA